MKLSIIGAGNMGGAIVRGLVQGSIFKPSDITVIDVFEAPLNALQDFNPSIRTALKDYDSVENADIILLAVKPWFIKDTILGIKSKLDYSKQVIVSIAAGISIDEMNESFLKENDEKSLPTVFRDRKSVV